MENDKYEEITSIVDELGSVYIYGMNKGQDIFDAIYNVESEYHSCIKIDGKNFVVDCNKLTDKDIRNKYFDKALTYFIFNVDNIFNDKKSLDYLFDLVEIEDISFIMLATNSFSNYNEDIRAGLSFLEEVCID